MGKETFANLIMFKLRKAIGRDGSTYTNATPAKAQLAIAEAITEYLIKNTKVHISYNGTLLTGTGTDPITSDIMQIKGKCNALSTPTDFTSWVTEIQSSIALTFSVVTPGADGVVVNFEPFNPIPDVLKIKQSELHNIFQQNKSDPARAVWEYICDCILKWLTGEDGKHPGAIKMKANRPGVSTGAASLVSIEVL